MKKEGLDELVEQLESIRVPDIRLESHQRRLKADLLDGGYAKEETFTEKAGPARSNEDSAGFPGLRRPVWKPVIIGIAVVAVLITALFSIPQTSAILKSAFFPEGTRTIGGPQLTAAEQKKATDILIADSRIKELLAEGAVIDKILPIEVVSEAVNPENGKVEQIKETLAQAWLVLGSKDWGVQIDLVRGQIVSITP